MPPRNALVGLTHRDKRSSVGYTLYSPAVGRHADLLDHQGRIVHQWYHPAGIQHPELLDDGRLLLRTAPPVAGAGQERIGGSSAGLVELDSASKVLWSYDDPQMHHDYERQANGNTIHLRWDRVPAEVAARVQGGYVAPEDPDWMFGDVIREIDPTGATVRDWRSWEHLSTDHHVKCPLESRKEWSHANSIQTTPDGRWLVSFRLTDTIALIDPTSGDVTWRWGPGELSHQHDAQWLDNGNILVYDNGCHRRGLPSFSRLVEVDPRTRAIVWQYVDTPITSTFSFMVSGCQRLPNGNTLFVEGASGRIAEVTTGGDVVWEWCSPWLMPSPFGLTSVVFRATRLAADDPRIADLDLDPDRYAELNAKIAAGNRLFDKDAERAARAAGIRLGKRQPRPAH